MYYLCSENKFANKLRGSRKANSRFSHDMAHYELLTCILCAFLLKAKYS